MNINKGYLAIAGAAVAGLAVGGGAGYLITKKVLKKKYESSLDKTIMGYESKIAELKKGAICEDVCEEKVETEEEVSKKTEEKPADDDEESDAGHPRLIDYTKFSDNLKTPTLRIDLNEEGDIISSVEKFVNKERSTDEYPESDPDNIIKESRPYLISKDQFYENERPWYDQKELILFMKDYIFINGEKYSVPILYSCDDDAIIDVFVSEEISKKLEAAGLTKTGIWAMDNLDLSMDDFGRDGFDYKEYEQIKRCDATEMECYVDVRRDKSYAEEMLDIDEVTENNYKDIYRELWQKVEEE